MKPKYSLKARFKYWFNSLITDNRVGLIVFLSIITVLFVLLLSVPMILDNSEGMISEDIWDNFATAINAWWPFSGDGIELGSDSVGRVLSKTSIAIFGLFLTSALIGYISERISEKFESLQRGKTEVIETGHIIVVGYDFNNHTLIRELIKANVNRKILIIDDKDILEVKENLKTNINVPSDVKIIYRSINSVDVDDLKKCSVETSYAIVIQPIDDIRTLKTIMALKRILKNYPENRTHIISAVANEDYLLKFSNPKDIMLSTNNLLARIIAVSNYEFGLSKVLISLFSFAESELYLKNIDKYVGLRFGQLLYKMQAGVPVGIYREGEYIVIPDENTDIRKDDELLYYAENRDAKVFLENVDDRYDLIVENKESRLEEVSLDTVLIFGYNNKFDTIINLFDSNVRKVIIANVLNEEIKHIKSLTHERKNFNVEFIMEEINRETLFKITEEVDHIIILSKGSDDKEQSDIDNMVLYLRLNKVRETTNSKWTMITELNYDANRELIADETNDDFIVSSNIISIMLAQMVEDYRLRAIFAELLSTEGLNVCIEDAHKYTVLEEKIADLRVKLLRKGAILLGYILYNDGNRKYVYNPNRNSVIDFEYGDKLILLKK